MSRCETCKHWFRYFGDGGTCDLFRTTMEWPVESGAPDIVNGNGSETRLRTLPTFGCTMHEPREERT